MITELKEESKQWWSCKYDRCFKKVIVDEKDHTLMEAILNSIFEEPVKIIRYHNTEMKVNTVFEKVHIADVLIELHGEFIHIEVETGIGMSTRIKNFTTFTTFYNQNVIRGDEFDTETKFLHITLQYGLGNNHPIKGYHYIMNPETNEKLINNIEILCINMDKLKKMWENGIEEANQYIYLIMLDLEREKLENFEKDDAIVSKFKKKITTLNDNPQFQAMMSYEERERLEHNTEKRLAYEDGMEQGEKQKQLEIAIKMINKNKPLEDIIEFTGLTMEELNNLKNIKNKSYHDISTTHY